MIEIHLYGKLRRFADSLDPRRESTLFVPADEGDTIRDTIERIGVPMAEVGSNIFLNGEYSHPSRPVKDGDRLGIFPDDMQLLYKWHFKKEGRRGALAKVDVRLYAALRRYVPQLGLGEAIKLELDEGATIRHILTRLGLPESEVKRVIVNGLSRGYEYTLSDGDRVAIFPPVAGG